ncbi:MAG: zf-HC2 domain-containing protein [Acidobacteriota bacterium]|nr:zf-HC2 domain-containing protein [Acidobacteriota bacterium]
MDHDYATAEHLAERYFLGELSDAEADAFEEHFFDCVECAAYVREELVMLEAGREVARAALAAKAPAPAPSNVVPMTPRRKVPSWISAAAAAMLVVAVVTPFQLRNGNSAPSMEIVRPVAVPFSAERGAGAAPLGPFAAGALISLDVAVPQSCSDDANCAIGVREMKSKKLAFASRRVAYEEKNPYALLLLRDLPAGSYEVAIEGIGADGKRVPLATQAFNVRK